jgi:AmmeMemoRadiSam system protein B
MTTRPAQFADNRWYPSSSKQLASDLTRYLGATLLNESALAVVSPHAGYFYSGAVAGSVYARVNIPDRVVIVGVNHRCIGAQQAIVNVGHWQIPGADVPIDIDAANAILSRAEDLVVDPDAHALEHSLELQLPFLVHRNPALRLVPISLGRVTLEDCRALGHALAETVKTLDGDTLLVASTDMNHYESAAIGNRKDKAAMAHIEALDPKGLLDTVRREKISMCGVLPTVTILFAARALGAQRATLAKYADSGDSSGDKTAVVGYAGYLID